MAGVVFHFGHAHLFCLASRLFVYLSAERLYADSHSIWTTIVTQQQQHQNNIQKTKLAYIFAEISIVQNR